MEGDRVFYLSLAHVERTTQRFQSSGKMEVREESHTFWRDDLTLPLDGVSPDMSHGYKAVGPDAIEHGFNNLPGVTIFYSDLSGQDEFDIPTGSEVRIVT